jgi:hypothetical protein
MVRFAIKAMKVKNANEISNDKLSTRALKWRIKVRIGQFLGGPM